MSVLVWLLAGAAVAVLFVGGPRFAFPTGRAVCMLGGIAGGFLGGGLYSVAAESSRLSLDLTSAAAAVAGALVVVVVAGWAGNDGRAPR